MKQRPRLATITARAIPYLYEGNKNYGWSLRSAPPLNQPVVCAILSRASLRPASVARFHYERLFSLPHTHTHTHTHTHLLFQEVLRRFLGGGRPSDIKKFRVPLTSFREIGRARCSHRSRRRIQFSPGLGPPSPPRTMTFSHATAVFLSRALFAARSLYFIVRGGVEEENGRQRGCGAREFRNIFIGVLSFPIS